MITMIKTFSKNLIYYATYLQRYRSKSSRAETVHSVAYFKDAWRWRCAIATRECVKLYRVDAAVENQTIDICVQLNLSFYQTSMCSSFVRLMTLFSRRAFSAAKQTKWLVRLSSGPVRMWLASPVYRQIIRSANISKDQQNNCFQ